VRICLHNIYKVVLENAEQSEAHVYF